MDDRRESVVQSDLVTRTNGYSVSEGLRIHGYVLALLFRN
jgi:hypothetical protein